MVNNKGLDVFITYFGGTFYSEKLSIANNTGSEYFLVTCADYTEFRECCIFRAISHPDLGPYTLIDCFTNYAHKGVITIETTINPFLFSRDCPFGRSNLFTKQENPTVSSVLLLIVLLIAHIWIYNVQ